MHKSTAPFSLVEGGDLELQTFTFNLITLTFDNSEVM